jgi:hypothetical protein
MVLCRLAGGFHLTVHVNLDMGAVYAAFFRVYCLIPDAGETEGVHLGHKALPVAVKLQQSGCEHITGGTHGAVKIKRFHKITP